MWMNGSQKKVRRSAQEVRIIPPSATPNHFFVLSSEFGWHRTVGQYGGACINNLQFFFCVFPPHLATTKSTKQKITTVIQYPTPCSNLLPRMMCTVKIQNCILEELWSSHMTRVPLLKWGYQEYHTYNFVGSSMVEGCIVQP